MKRTTPTPQQITAALAFQSLRLSRLWRIHWPRIEPTVKRYQVPVCLARVLAEHHGAVTAEPLGQAEG